MVASVMRKASLMALLAIVSVSGLHAELIDRVVAVVNGAVIMQSDVRAVLRLGLMEVPPDPEVGRAVANRLIDRRLVLIEVNRSATPDPPEGLIDARLSEVRSRFASPDDFDKVMAEVGYDERQVRTYIRDDLRISTYLQQRFGATVQPAEAELLEYYRDHPEKFTRNGVLLSFGEAYDDIRAAVIEERRAAMIRAWIDTLRRRADITIPAVVRR
jgi:peptidyl-prolyl cis-trans isomerase SurA